MQDVLDFWFLTLKPSDRFKKSDELDLQIKAHFESTYHQVVAGETAHWRDTANGRLAEIIVLDQFSRNMFRNTPMAFSADPLALALAQEAIRGKGHLELDESQRTFLYMPFMHSESSIIHDQAMALFKDLPNLEFEIRHKAIIDQFGRYPHRNQILGRVSTAVEIAWMKDNAGF